MENRALKQALLTLAHPLTVGAVLVLLLNDVVLRWRWSSWMTGKLGDVAWLFFAPLAAAVVVALVLPRRLPHRSTWVGALALGLVAVPFTLGNTWPAALEGMRTVYRQVLGSEPSMVGDPSDLLALPVLFLTWGLWRSVDVTSRRAPRRAWALLLLASLATLGNGAAPDYGILCLSRMDGEVAATGGPWQPEHAFLSDDGGLTWREGPRAGEELACPEPPKPRTLEVPGSSETYRFERGVRIEVSRDGGQTWTTAFDLGGLEARTAYRQTVQGTSDTLGPGPFDALIDPTTGNLVLAMGREGVLMRTADGEWEWAAVGPYRYVPLETIDQVAVLLQGEIWLAVALALVTFAGWSSQMRGPWAVGLVVALGLAWCVTATAARPATVTGYVSPLAFFPTVALALLAIPLAAWQGWRGYKASATVPLGAAVMGLGAGAAYLAPLVLWGFGLVPRYTQALWGALVLVALSWVPVAYQVIRGQRWGEEEDGEGRGAG